MIGRLSTRAGIFTVRSIIYVDYDLVSGRSTRTLKEDANAIVIRVESANPSSLAGFVLLGLDHIQMRWIEKQMLVDQIVDTENESFRYLAYGNLIDQIGTEPNLNTQKLLSFGTGWVEARGRFDDIGGFTPYRYGDNPFMGIPDMDTQYEDDEEYEDEDEEEYEEDENDEYYD